jgi:thioredoxin-dependent peroxiredoxin
MKYLLLATVAGLLTLTLQDALKSAPKAPEVGQPAPALRLNDHTGKIVMLGGKTKNWSVLAFYPKAMTPGCTSEVCSMRDSFETLTTVGADIYGISLDSVQDQAQFVQKHDLNFALLSDPDGSVATKYGVLDPTGQYTKRVTFVIDEKGVLRKVLDQVDVKTHGEDLAALIDELRK